MKNALVVLMALLCLAGIPHQAHAEDKVVASKTAEEIAADKEAADKLAAYKAAADKEAADKLAAYKAAVEKEAAEKAAAKAAADKAAAEKAAAEKAAKAAKAAAAKPTKERLVLMPLRVSEEDKGLQGAMEAALVQGLQEKYEVFSGEQVAQKAKEIFLKESRSATVKKDCDETRCMQNIAEAFQAELISTANVTKRQDGYFLAISIQNIFDNKVVFSNSMPCKYCDVYQVVDRLKDLSSKVAVAQVQKVETSFRDCPDCPEMVIVPKGKFEMGSDVLTRKTEIPRHTVTFAKPFALGRTEVTQGQWKVLMGSNPSEFKECGDNCPVEKVSWDDAQEYIKKLNAKTGKQYRLPSEAEWEFACRAGDQNEYCGSDMAGNVAWYGASTTPLGNSGQMTHPVGTKQPNDLGIFDMSGNVWEWVQDGEHGDYKGAPADGSVWIGDNNKRVVRGGSWYHGAEFLGATVRGSFKADSRNGSFGFRVAISLK